MTRTVRTAVWLLVCAAIAGAAPAPAPAPGPILWLDATDPDGDGNPANDPDDGSPLSRWADKSGSGRDARQPLPERQPTLSRRAGGPTVRFRAEAGQFLAVPRESVPTPDRFTAFAVARATAGPANMWLFGSNRFDGPWIGYGVAVNGRSLAPWPHVGLGSEGVQHNGYLTFRGTLSPRSALVDVRFDGRRLTGGLNGRTDSMQTVRGTIAPTDRDLLIGASPQHLPATEFLDGDIAELLLYDRALEPDELRQTREYLAAKHGVELAEEDVGMAVILNGYLPLIVENPVTPETRTPTPEEAQDILRRDWLAQAEGADLAARTREEIARARSLAARVGDDAGADSLDRCERELDAEPGPERIHELYLAVRRTKREILFRLPSIDFSSIVFIDQPYPEGPEARHEAMHRLGITAVPGGRLLVLDGLRPGGTVRQLAPQRPGAFWRPDVSFDAKRVLFCYKGHDDPAFSLYEIRADGSGLRRLSDGPYDDIDPIYLPDGHIAFTTTRGNTYVRCGPYIPSYILARCDGDGRNIRLISQNSEPDFLPALLDDGRIAYSRWEYSDKDQNRVQSLWTTRQDGTHTTVLWGNQSVWPDHLAEPRPIPGTGRIMFTGVGHHDWFSGSVGVIEPRAGLNYPLGITRVTTDLPWAEVLSPAEDRAESGRYRAPGPFSGYMGPYPLSDREFLVSARGRDGKFRIYLMDTDGNGELIHEGTYNAWYPIPLRPRTPPPRHPAASSETAAGPGEGTFYNPDLCEGVPELDRSRVRFLRVLQQDAKTYSTHIKTFAFSGPAVSAVQTEAVKRIVSVVPVEADGSVSFSAPAGQALYFQLLDEGHRALHTMRSFTGILPGEQRSCIGCHEARLSAPAAPAARTAARRAPTPVTPPPWGNESIGYRRFVQPVLDRYCGDCHAGEGKARKTFDITERPAEGPFAGHFTEPYLTLVGPAAWPVAVPDDGRAGYGLAGLFPVYGLRDVDTEVGCRPEETHPVAITLGTLRPLRALSLHSPLIRRASSGEHHEVRVDPLSLRRLIAWVDANGPYLGDEEIREMPDPEFAGIEELPVPPRLRSAPVVARP